MHWNISRKIYVIVAASLAALLISGAVSYRSTGKLTTTANWVNHTHQVLEQCSQIKSLLKDAETGQRGFLITGDSKYLDPYNNAQTALPAAVQEVQSLTADNPQQQSRIGNLRSLIDAKLAELKETINLRSTSGFDAALAVVKTDRGKAVMDQIRGTLNDMEGAERSLLTVREADAKSTASGAQTTTIVMALLSLAGCGLLAFFIMRGINRALEKSIDEVRVGAEQVASASGQVASASQQLAQGCTEQAASLEETSASGQEINSMAQRNTENAKQAAILMADVDSRVEQANKRLDQMVVSMSEITNSSERIAKIIKVIDDIAFQTNILALNAAVEAARAGEAGMGFAVVADEVRNLAQRCAQAAKDTTALIEESVANARSGSTRLDEVGLGIRGITESTTKVKTIIDEVSLGAVEQTRGLDLIAKSLSEMEQTTQQAAANAEESAAASEELRAQSGSMQEIVKVLEALIYARAVDSRPASGVSALCPASHPAPRVTTDLTSLRKAVGPNRSHSLPRPSASALPLEEEHQFHEF